MCLISFWGNKRLVFVRVLLGISMRFSSNVNLLKYKYFIRLWNYVIEDNCDNVCMNVFISGYFLF